MPASDTIVRELLEEVAQRLGLDATVEVEEHDGELVGTLTGEDLGLFIGRHGQTIDAVQHLAQRAVAANGPESERTPGEGRRIVVDAEGYRARRREALERVAEQAAQDALENERPVALDAMTASERRHVHEYLRDRGGVDTHSEGDEPHRHLVVSPLVSR